VRSGVLTSVHAFASDPERGLFILGILVIVVGGSLTLFAARAGSLASESRYELVSREMFLLTNNLLLVTATTVVFLGTLFPLVADALELGKISVGPPYFNLLFVPLTLLLMVFIAIGPQANWKRHEAGRLLRPYGKVLMAALVAGVALPLALFGDADVHVLLASVLSAWVVFAMGRDLWQKTGLRQRRPVGRPAAPLPQLCRHAAGTPRSCRQRDRRGVHFRLQCRTRCAHGAWRWC